MLDKEKEDKQHDYRSHSGEYTGPSPSKRLRLDMRHSEDRGCLVLDMFRTLFPVVRHGGCDDDPNAQRLCFYTVSSRDDDRRCRGRVINER